jgi:hypothetical protein
MTSRFEGKKGRFGLWRSRSLWDIFEDFQAQAWVFTESKSQRRDEMAQDFRDRSDSPTS